MDSLKKSFLIIILIIGVIAMTIAFASLSTRLSVSGTASVASTTWNIRFQNWQNNTNNKVTYGGNQHDNTAVYPDADDLQQTVSKNNSTKVEGINVTLNQPGDYVSYTFQIINEGTIDASLSSFSHNLTCASGNDCSHLSYEVTCTDQANGGNNVLTQYSTLPKNGGLAYCALTVTYNDTTNQNSGNAGSDQTYTKAAASAELDATWIYIQKVADNSGSGSGSGEQQTPANPYQTTFNGTYGYDFAGALTSGNGGDSEWVSSLDPNVTVYMRNDGTKNEVCGVFGSGQAGTVCLVPNADGYESDFETAIDGTYTESTIDTSEIKGYSLAKAKEMLSKGADSCTYYDDYNYMDCDLTSGLFCRVYNVGSVQCDDNNGSDLPVESDGSAWGHSAS